MAFLELKCDKCGYETEELVRTCDKYPKCPKCGQDLIQKYSGKCNSIKKSSCSGHCGSCGGCK